MTQGFHVRTIQCICSDLGRVSSCMEREAFTEHLLFTSRLHAQSFTWIIWHNQALTHTFPSSREIRHEWMGIGRTVNRAYPQDDQNYQPGATTQSWQTKGERTFSKRVGCERTLTAQLRSMSGKGNVRIGLRDVGHPRKRDYVWGTAAEQPGGYWFIRGRIRSWERSLKQGTGTWLKMSDKWNRVPLLGKKKKYIWEAKSDKLSRLNCQGHHGKWLVLWVVPTPTNTGWERISFASSSQTQSEGCPIVSWPAYLKAAKVIRKEAHLRHPSQPRGA